MGVTKGASKDVGADYNALSDPVANVRAGTAYLKLRVDWAKGDVGAALAGYGTGPAYAKAILGCEACLKAAQEDRQRRACLFQLHP